MVSVRVLVLAACCKSHFCACKALSEPHKMEKQGVSQIFERETTREKNLNQGG
jgi:hypothetical protein